MDAIVADYIIVSYERPSLHKLSWNFASQFIESEKGVVFDSAADEESDGKKNYNLLTTFVNQQVLDALKEASTKITEVDCRPTVSVELGSQPVSQHTPEQSGWDLSGSEWLSGPLKPIVDSLPSNLQNALFVNRLLQG